MFFYKIKVLLKAKYTFFPPKKKDILIYDALSLKIISKIFLTKNFEIIHTRKEKINLFILLKTFLSFQFSFFDYLINYIKYSSAKLVITSMDNDMTFYKLKSRLPVLTIFFQNGARNVQEDVFSILEKKINFKNLRKKNHVDLMCTFNKITGEKYKKFIKGENFVSGSILGNEKKISNLKKNILVYVSLYRPPERRKIPTEERTFLKIIEKYCTEKKIKMIILCKFYKGTIKGRQEYSFYKNNINQNSIIILNDPKRETFKILDQSKLIVNIGSTLGFEALARKKRVALCHPYPLKDKKRGKKRFGYLSKKSKNGFFWHVGISEKNIFKLFDRVINTSNSKWLSILKKNNEEVIYYDFKNFLLKQKLKKFLALREKNLKKYIRN